MTTLDIPAAGSIEQELAITKLRYEALRNDLSLIGDMLLEEARRRDWCSEYDEFVRNVNESTSERWLVPCLEYHVASYTVIVNYRCPRGSSGDATTEIRSYLQGALESSDTVVEDIHVRLDSNEDG